MIPERSSAGNSAKSVLFEEFNDIDIYIEDTAHGYVKLFTEIFSRFFDGEYRVSNVFPLGGRDAVINECRSWQGKFSRPSLYVIDGDMYLITERGEEELDGLFVLPMYCIENLLIDESAFLEILNEEEAVKLKEQLASEFDFSSWLEQNGRLLTDLFIEYAICFDICPTVKTVSYPISSLVSSNKGNLDETKVDQRITDLRNQIIENCGEDLYQSKREYYQGRSQEVADFVLRYVSGKDYLMPLLLTRSRSIVKTKVPNLNLKLRLAMKCDLEPLLECKERIAG